jgi:hypothetical protein
VYRSKDGMNGLTDGDQPVMQPGTSISVSAIEAPHGSAMELHVPALV